MYNCVWPPPPPYFSSYSTELEEKKKTATHLLAIRRYTYEEVAVLTQKFHPIFLGSCELHNCGMKLQILEITANVCSSFYLTDSKHMPGAVRLLMCQRRLFASLKAEVVVMRHHNLAARQSTKCGGWRPYNRCVAESCQISLYDCVVLLEM